MQEDQKAMNLLNFLNKLKVISIEKVPSATLCVKTVNYL